MIQSLPRRHLPQILSAFLVIAGGSIAALAVTELAGTKTGGVLAILAIAGPILVYLTLAAPLIFPFGVYELSVPFENILSTPTYGTLTKLLGIVAGIAIVFFILRTRRAVRPPKAVLIWAALYVWSACTAFWALDTRSLFQMLPTSIELVLLYAAISMLPTDRNAVRWVTFATIAGGVLAAAYGAYLAHGGADLWYGGRLRITTSTSAIDPNHFAAALLLPIVLCVTLSMYSRKVLPALLGIGAIGMLLVGLALTQSRGGIIAVFAMLIYVFIRSARRWRLALVAVPAAIIGVYAALQTTLASRFQDAFSTGGAGRMTVWHVGFDALKSHWLIGAGYNNFVAAYDQAYLQSGQMAFGDWHRGPHNLLVGYSVEVGVIGLVLLLAGWVAQFRILRFIPPEDPDYPLRLAVEAAVIGLFIAAQFLDVMVFKYVWLAFMLGAIVRSAHRSQEILETEHA